MVPARLQPAQRWLSGARPRGRREPTGDVWRGEGGRSARESWREWVKQFSAEAIARTRPLHPVRELWSCHQQGLPTVGNCMLVALTTLSIS